MCFNRYTRSKILHNRLNTKQLLFKMKISDSEECPYCVNIPDSTLHALINCPISAYCGDMLNYVNKSIKISDKEKILGYKDNDIDKFIINM